MRSAWQAEAGRLACHWSEAVHGAKYDAPWMREAPNVQGSYLEPLTDFASHSPFCGASWFTPRATVPADE